MGIFIQHKGQQTGPFTHQQIQQGVASGLYQTSDLVWYEGAAGWMPLSQLPHISDPAAQLPFGGIPQTSGLAITSMVLGISSFLCGITGIPAVICGHIARGNIRRSHGQQTGAGLALAGLITGYLGTAIVLIAMLAGLTAPMVIRQRKKADQTEAVSNARSFGLALMEFQNDYGRFPDTSTARLVADNTNTPEISGSSSNARFRQLIQAALTQSESMFYAKAEGVRKPDGIITGDRALAPGECGFGYIENIRTDDGIPRPLAMAPFVKGRAEFDPMPFDHKAVILWSDNSVRSLPIDRITCEVIHEGQNLLDPAHPVWGGVPPSLLLPE
jgi:type II secretory pathway pseudopilin PulG